MDKKTDKETLQKPKNKKVLVGIVVAAILLLGLIFGSITIAGNTPARRADKYLDLGDKYLRELDYEQALVAYRQVLEIEPKNLEAYKGGLAAYAGLGDREGMAEFYADALGVIESMTEQELKQMHDTAVGIYLYANTVYPENHEVALQALERGYDTLGGDERIIRALVAEYGILAGAYIDAGDYAKEEAIYQKILEKELENADVLSDWEQRVRERFQEYLSRNGRGGNAPGATSAPTLEHTPEPTPETTPEPTAQPTVEPTAEPTPESARYVDELFTVNENEYESYGNAYGGSIPVKKDGKWGAVNYENKVIVPFEYDGFEVSADNQGWFVLYKSTFTESASFLGQPYQKETREYFLFDNQGKIIYQGTDYVRASGGMYITWSINSEEAKLSLKYHRMDGSVLAAVECDPPSIYYGFYDGVCYVEYDDTIGMVDLQGNVTRRENPDYAAAFNKWTERQQNEAEETARGEHVYSGEANAASWDGFSYYPKVPISTINHGYYVLSGKIEWTGLILYDAGDNKVAEFNHRCLKMDENGKITMDGNDWDEMRYRGYFVDGFTFYNYGSEMVFLVGEKNVLIDLAKNTGGAEGQPNLDEMVLAVYDYVEMADEKYWLVQSGENWGYIDHEGREMAMFEDAGAFRNGYAMVKENGEAWLIDESFQKLQNLGAADGVSTWGENYMVQSGDKYHFYHLLNQ